MMMTFEATYYAQGGASAEEVRLELTSAGLVLHRDRAVPEVWPLGELRRQDGAIAGGPVRIEYGGSLLFITDRVLLNSLGYGEERGGATLWKALAIMAASTVALGVVGYLWVLPWIADVMARSVPERVEAELGKAAIEQLAPRAKRIDDPEVRRPVQDVIARLAGGNVGRYQLFVVRDEAVNALATPGGYIVVYTGLLNKTREPEELAAVLGHEMTHVTERHGTQALMRSIAFWAMLGYVTGDAGGVLVQSAGALGELKYRRGQEESADRGAMQLFEEARLDPRAMVRVFEMLEREESKLPDAVQYLSTHPRIADRLSVIRQWAASVGYTAKPLDVDGSWPPSLSSR